MRLCSADQYGYEPTNTIRVRPCFLDRALSPKWGPLLSESWRSQLRVSEAIGCQHQNSGGRISVNKSKLISV